jgi:hypothetical protein
MRNVQFGAVAVPYDDEKCDHNRDSVRWWFSKNMDNKLKCVF